MARRLSSAKRTYTLRNAAAVVFALTSILPMLLFTYTLYALHKLQEMQAAIGLGLALFFALIGGFIFMNLMGRLSELLRFIEEQAESEPAAPAPASNPATPSAPGTRATDGRSASPSRPDTAAGHRGSRSWNHHRPPVGRAGPVNRRL